MKQYGNRVTDTRFSQQICLFLPLAQQSASRARAFPQNRDVRSESINWPDIRKAEKQARQVGHGERVCTRPVRYARARERSSVSQNRPADQICVSIVVLRLARPYPLRRLCWRFCAIVSSFDVLRD